MTKLFNSIRERLEKATPGPWKEGFHEIWDSKARRIATIDSESSLRKKMNENTYLISNAPTDIATLLKAVDRMQEALARVCTTKMLCKAGGACDVCEALAAVRELDVRSGSQEGES
jgi:hypothetical protein